MPVKKTTVSKRTETAAAAKPRTRVPKAAADGIVKPRAARAKATKVHTASVAASATEDLAPVASPARTLVTREDIQVRAYYLSLEHGGRGGSLDFWLQAEQELLRPGVSRD